MKKLIVTFDPGVSGGIAIGVDSPVLHPMPETVHDLAELIRCAQASADYPVEAHVELVGGFIGKAQPASRAFVFGQSYGQVLGVLAALQIPVHLVRPQKWQALLAIGNGAGAPKHQWKAKLKAKAQQLYPTLKITLQTADALLLWHLAQQGKL